MTFLVPLKLNNTATTDEAPSFSIMTFLVLLKHNYKYASNSSSFSIMTFLVPLKQILLNLL